MCWPTSIFVPCADEPVFKRAYTASRLFLQRLEMNALKRSIHYHLFRHSSATYYASKLNRQQLCIRYGWSLSSRMPDVYIARSGVDMEEMDKKFTGAEVETLKGSLARMEQESQLKAGRNFPARAESRHAPAKPFRDYGGSKA